MSTPKPGCRVRLVTLAGVASPSMRACLGKVGTVVRVRGRSGVHEAEVRFGCVLDGPETFWLTEREVELLDEPADPVQPTQPTKPVQEQPVVADFRTAVQTRIDQLGAADAELARQIDDLAQQRATNARERKALEAAVGAYERVRLGAAVPVARRVGQRQPAEVKVLPLARELAARADGRVSRADAAAALLEAGAYGNRRSAESAVDVALGRHADVFEKVGKGLWCLRDRIAS